MVEEAGAEAGYGDRFFMEINTRIRDIEEKQRLLRDRMLLISDGFVKEREKAFSEMQDMKKAVIMLTEDTKRIKALLQRIGERVDEFARKEDVMILQRQFDLFRKD